MTLEDIKKAIEQHVPQSEAVILDPMQDGQHLQAFVISSSFEEMPLVKQHQAVMKPLKDAFGTDTLHALALKTFTPEAWEKQKNQFGF